MAERATIEDYAEPERASRRPSFNARVLRNAAILAPFRRAMNETDNSGGRKRASVDSSGAGSNPKRPKSGSSVRSRGASGTGAIAIPKSKPMGKGLRAMARNSIAIGKRGLLTKPFADQEAIPTTEAADENVSGRPASSGPTEVGPILREGPPSSNPASFSPLDRPSGLPLVEGNGVDEAANNMCARTSPDHTSEEGAEARRLSRERALALGGNRAEGDDAAATGLAGSSPPPAMTPLTRESLLRRIEGGDPPSLKQYHRKQLAEAELHPAVSVDEILNTILATWTDNPAVDWAEAPSVRYFLDREIFAPAKRAQDLGFGDPNNLPGD